MKIKELIFEEKEIPEILKKEADCLYELGIKSYEINYIITLKFKGGNY